MRGSIGVRAAHCCKWHGCKYGDPACPIANGEIEQEYPCEDCCTVLAEEEYYKRMTREIDEIKGWREVKRKMDSRKFIIECEVPERWIDDFCSFLKHLERNGKIGHSALIGFYADGDGDFRPTFNIQTDYTKTSGCTTGDWTPETTYDAS